MKLSPSGFFVLRTPLLPYEELTAWGRGLRAPAAGNGDSLDQALVDDRRRLRNRLLRLVERPELRDAVLLGSLDLAESMEHWRREPDTERGPGIERALVRYVMRAASRPTPFGLFAGTSVGTIGQRTRLTIEGRDRYRRHSRLDTSYLVALARGVAAAPEVRRQLTLVPNPMLYPCAGGLRWPRSCPGREDRTALTAIPLTPLLRSALALAAGGTTAPILAAGLARDGRPIEQSERYVEELVRLQLLMPALGITVTGREPIQPFVEQLETEPSTSPIAGALRSAAHELADMDAAGLGAHPQRYRAIAGALGALPTAAEPSGLFHVDLVKPAPDAVLGIQVVDELRRAVAVLHRLARPRTPGDLDRFRDAFERRYEAQEIPLPEAVDGDAGVGFGPSAPAVPLLFGLCLPPEPSAGTAMTAADELLLAKLISAAVQHEAEIVLEQDDIDAMASEQPALPLPGAFSVLAAVEARGDEALDRGDFQVLVKAMGGPSGVWLLGRFCHADPALHDQLDRHLRAEEAQDPEAVWAEVVHLPSGRFSNVVPRPVLRPYEIPCQGRSGAAAARQLPLDDLLVSVVEGRVVLRSRRLGRRVIPRTTTAHDFSRNGPPAYRFLASLQLQGVTAGLSWTWGALAGAPFLPRVRHGRVVLSLARWHVPADELRSMRGLDGSALAAHLRRWRSERRIPRLVSLVDGDATLLVDFDNVLSSESFVHLVRGRRRAVLEEVFPAPQRLCVRGPEGSFVHELVVPFISSAPAPPTRLAASAVPTVARRCFPPGSEWLSAKLYTGPATADHLLTDVVGPLRRRLIDSGVADGWFFVRYGDPQWHLRVRLHLTPDGDPTAVLDELCRVFAIPIEDGRAWRLQLDTYHREVARYGGQEGAARAERLFCVDSDAVMELLRTIPKGDAGADDRWKAAMASVDRLLDDLGLNDDEKLRALRRGRNIYAREHRVDATLEDQLSRRFRTHRRSLEALLQPAATVQGALGACLAVLTDRSRSLAPLAAELRSLEGDGRLAPGVEMLATSYVHLHLNRLLASAHRAQELVVYDTLLRLHRSRSARRQAGG